MKWLLVYELWCGWDLAIFSCWEDSVTVGVFIKHPSEKGMFSFQVSTWFLTVISNKYWNSSGSDVLIYSPPWTPNTNTLQAYKMYMVWKKRNNEVVPVYFCRDQKPRYYELICLYFQVIPCMMKSVIFSYSSVSAKWYSFSKKINSCLSSA